MTIKEVVKSARHVDSCNPCVERAQLFSGIGQKDPYEGSFDSDAQIVDVCSARKDSLLNIVKRAKGCDITRYNVVRQFASEEADKRLDGLEHLDSFGYIEKYIDPVTSVVRYDITFLSKLLCGARFTLCKELSHIMTDTVDGVEECLDAMFKCATRWMESICAADADLDHETTGFYHAIEVLIPWRLRNEFNDIKEDTKLTTKEDRDMTIAQRFMIPTKVVSHICDCRENSNELPYCGFSYSVNSAI